MGTRDEATDAPSGTGQAAPSGPGEAASSSTGEAAPSGPGADAPSGFDEVPIPVGGGFWRALGRNGALVVGYGLLALHVGVMVVVASVLAGDRLTHAAESRLASLTLWSTVLLPLLALCFISIGELIRRARWGGASSHGSVTVTMRLLPVRWNLVWIVLAGVPAWLTLDLSVRDATHYDFGGHLEGILAVNGVLVAGVLGAAVGALVKKVAWLRRGQSRRPEGGVGEAPDADTRGRRFWRSFGFRWRFDIWLCAFGGVALWTGGWAFRLADELSGAREAGWGFAAVGVVLLAVGLWATTQFWRSGEHLASAESAA